MEAYLKSQTKNLRLLNRNMQIEKLCEYNLLISNQFMIS